MIDDATNEREGASADKPLTNVPRHVAIIMDGNGRWARRRGMPRAAGHRAGTENLRNILRDAVDFGIEVLTIYAFSTENWKRPRQEVDFLLRLIEHVIDSELDELNRSGVRIRHIGHLEGLSQRVADKVRYAQDITRNNDRLILNVAFNYGGRMDVVDAVRQLLADGVPAEEVDEKAISERLSTAGLPDPDLIIRTAGEMRLSNFLIWQAAYAEFYSTPTYWPDFNRAELHRALQDYAQRERRFGSLGPSSTV
ncbi:MAG TPA: isoprenyl transferase [Chloroflexi bacterium]|jgi:undecaprenyl diphosphate synthase|nr:isoprenyl transferase [Chloroflexota bacterium]